MGKIARNECTPFQTSRVRTYTRLDFETSHPCSVVRGLPSEAVLGKGGD
jgi:hypothetical protein